MPCQISGYIPGHVWGRAEQEYPTQIGLPNLVEQATGQQTAEKRVHFGLYQIVILSDLIFDAGTCKHLPGERTLTSSYRWPFRLQQEVMANTKTNTKTKKHTAKEKYRDKDTDNDLQHTAMERRRRREVMTARMMAMITVLRPPLLRLISSVRTWTALPSHIVLHI